MWIRASAAPYDQCGEGTIERFDCIDLLTSGLKSCDPDGKYTFGLTVQGKNCIEYSLDTSDSVHEGDPPWNQHVVSFPPGEHEPLRLRDGDKPFDIDCVGDGLEYAPEEVDGLIKALCHPNGRFPEQMHPPSAAIRYGNNDGNLWVIARPNPFTWADENWCRYVYALVFTCCVLCTRREMR